MASWKTFAVYVLGVVAPLIAQSVQEQSATGTGATQAQVILAKLHDPVYPSNSALAAIQGSVNLTLRINTDGSIQSIGVVSGPPMLRQAAIDSAKGSRFECRGCDGEPQVYSLTYEFQLVPTDAKQFCSSGATDNSQLPVKVDPSLHTVTVSAEQVWTCDPVVERLKERSIKCLHLWKCAFHEIASRP